MTYRDTTDNGFGEIYLDDIGELRRDVFPGIYERLDALEQSKNNLVEELDIAKSENSALARNQRYLSDLVGGIVISMIDGGGGIKLEKQGLVFYPHPKLKFVCPKSDLFSGKCSITNWLQLRNAPKKKKNKKGS